MLGGRTRRTRPRRGPPGRALGWRLVLALLGSPELVRRIPPWSGLAAHPLAGEGPIGPLAACAFFNAPVPIGSTSSTAANVNTDGEGGAGRAPHNETTIAVNPTNPLNLIGSANDYQFITNG